VIHGGHYHLPLRVPSGPRLNNGNAPRFSFCSLHANFPPTHKIDNTIAMQATEINPKPAMRRRDLITRCRRVATRGPSAAVDDAGDWLHQRGIARYVRPGLESRVARTRMCFSMSRARWPMSGEKLPA
jgi:hypothetical protein